MGRETGGYRRGGERTCSTRWRGFLWPLGPSTAGCTMGGRALTCCLSGLVTKEPGLAAWDGLELSILWGWRQALGSGGQECIKVLQPCDLEDKRTEKLPSRGNRETRTEELPRPTCTRQAGLRTGRGQKAFEPHAFLLWPSDFKIYNGDQAQGLQRGADSSSPGRRGGPTIQEVSLSSWAGLTLHLFTVTSWTRPLGSTKPVKAAPTRSPKSP